MSVFDRLFGSAPRVSSERPIRRAPNSDDSSPLDRARRAASERRVAMRNMDELIGMCRMVLADGLVEDHEARYLLDWVVKNYHATQEWPGNLLYPRLMAAMKDGHIDHEEESELLEVLAQIAGGSPSAAGPPVSGAIPYDDPPPTIVFKEHCFVLTGQFVYGTRKKVAATIEDLGGLVASAVSGKRQYLVVGTFGSEEWLHSTHGTKIIKAVELKQDGKAIQIVTEQHWAEQLS